MIIVPLYRLYLLLPIPPPLSDNGLLYDQYFGIILIHVIFQLGFCTFVLSNYMKTISRELTEAALADGASVGRIYWSVILPLCKPALAALATLEFTFIYNDFFWALLLMKSGDRRPITSALNNLRASSSPISVPVERIARPTARPSQSAVSARQRAGAQAEGAGALGVDGEQQQRVARARGEREPERRERRRRARGRRRVALSSVENSRRWISSRPWGLCASSSTGTLEASRNTQPFSASALSLCAPRGRPTSQAVATDASTASTRGTASLPSQPSAAPPARAAATSASATPSVEACATAAPRKIWLRATTQTPTSASADRGEQPDAVGRPEQRPGVEELADHA